LSALCGQTFGGPFAALPAEAATALVPFIENPTTRSHVTLCLACLPLSPEMKKLLQRVIAIGTAEEAALARRTLAGEKVVNLGKFDDEAERRHIAQTNDPAAGRVFFWVQRQEQSHQSA